MKSKKCENLKFLILATFACLIQFVAPKAQTSTMADLKRAANLVEESRDSEAEMLLNKILIKASSENRNQALMTLARLKFQEKKFTESIKLYKQISASSKFWAESIEERAWAELQNENFEAALSLYHTLSTQALSDVVGPEAFLIGAIADLRICNYKGSFDDIKLFKERFKSRIQSLKEAAKNPKQSKNANLDLADIQSVIKKMHIIEIEAVQRMGLKRSAGGEFSKQAETSRDTIRFPKESEEWLDEAKFDVSAKRCNFKTTKISSLKAGEKK